METNGHQIAPTLESLGYVNLCVYCGYKGQVSGLHWAWKKTVWGVVCSECSIILRHRELDTTDCFLPNLARVQSMEFTNFESKQCLRESDKGPESYLIWLSEMRDRKAQAAREVEARLVWIGGQWHDPATSEEYAAF